MPRTYAKGDGDTIALLNKAIEAYHAELKELNVRVGVILVSPPKNAEGEPTGAAVTHAGHEVLATVKLTTPADRVFSPYDAIVRIDQERFDLMIEEQQLALLDHELTHLVVRRDDDGHPLLTEDLRPKLALKPDDIFVTGFAEVAERHGEHSVEVRTMRGLQDRFGQLLFPWANDKAARKAAASR